MSPKVIPKAQQLVALDEVAYQMGGAPVETAVARLGHLGQTPAVDWQGRLAVPVEVAAELVDGYEQEVAQADERRARTSSTCVTARTTDRRPPRSQPRRRSSGPRSRTARATRQLRRLRRRGAAQQCVHPAAASAARRQALAGFDKRFPVQSFEEWEA